VNAHCWNSARHKYSYWRRLSKTLNKIWIVTATLFQGQTHRYEDTMRTWTLYRGVYHAAVKTDWKFNSVGQKLSTVWGNFSQGAGTPGTGRDIAFSQLAVKGLGPCIRKSAIPRQAPFPCPHRVVTLVSALIHCATTPFPLTYRWGNPPESHICRTSLFLCLCHLSSFLALMSAEVRFRWGFLPVADIMCGWWFLNRKLWNYCWFC
jgi:hypothetical protein